jgi:hypothetical protein
MTAAREEASRLWARYGVQLAWLERRSDCARLTAPATCLFLILSRRLGSSGAAPPALGQVEFAPDGQPYPEIRIAYDTVATMLARRDRRFGPDGPMLFRALVVGRALGRVAAHEIGHVVIGSRTHAATGLMRRSFDANDLSSWSSHGFSLSPLETAAIAARLTSRDSLMALSPASGASR